MKIKNFKVKIYGNDGCVWCEKAFDWAFERGFYVEYHKIKNKDDAIELAEKYKMNTVPIILVNNELIGGYLDLINSPLAYLKE